MSLPKRTVNLNGAVEYRNKDGKFHREGGPAIEHANGAKEWYLNGKLHREDGPAIEHADGDKSWYINGKHHRENGPAVEIANGEVHWYLNGKRHREDGPAVEHANGYKEWYQNGKLHREDGPAIEYVNGDKSWYLNDALHREDGPAVECADGYKEWFLNGKRHREDGPAVEYVNGDKYWYQNGKLHREDGPAIEFANGAKGWYLNDEEVTEKQVMSLLNKTVDPDGTTRYRNKNNELHREDGPALVLADGFKIWYQNGSGVKKWYLNGEKVTEEQCRKKTKGTKMEQLINTAKEEGSDALYRIATKQTTSKFRAALVKTLREKGADDVTVEILSKFFESEIGCGLISLALGLALPQVPYLKDDGRITRLSKEFRVEGMSATGNAIIDEVLSGIAPIMMDVLKSLPEEDRVRVDTNQTVRVSESENSEPENSEPEVSEDEEKSVSLAETA